MRRDRGGLSAAAALVVAFVAGAELYLALAFGCGSSDVIPNCSRSSEVAAWWALPGASLVLATVGLVGAVLGRRVGLARLAVALAGAAALVWYLFVFRP